MTNFGVVDADAECLCALRYRSQNLYQGQHGYSRFVFICWPSRCQDDLALSLCHFVYLLLALCLRLSCSGMKASAPARLCACLAPDLRNSTNRLRHRRFGNSPRTHCFSQRLGTECSRFRERSV
jgi:hypothetical protein